MPNTLARALGCDVSLVNAWLDDLDEIPVQTGAWIEALARVHQQTETLKPVGLKGRRFRG
jgi:hypothetical protein